jgi:hypothetical protein
MPDSVKISELSPRTAIATDVIPAVDATFSQTVRVSAQSIAQIGGGPPGDNTVGTAKLQGGAVTAAKVGFSAPDRLLSRIDAGAGVATEITCTSYARGLLAIDNSAAALAYFNGLQSANNPTFTGTVTMTGDLSIAGNAIMTGGQFRAIAGTATAPAYSFATDTNTGIFSSSADTLSFSTDGTERLRVGSTGTLSSQITPSGSLYPHFGVRAYAHWSFGTFNGGGISSITFVATGVYNILFATPMPDAHYAILTSGPNDIGPVDVLWSWLPAPATQTQGFRLVLVAPNASNLAATGFMFAVVR